MEQQCNQEPKTTYKQPEGQSPGPIDYDRLATEVAKKLRSSFGNTLPQTSSGGGKNQWSRQFQRRPGSSSQQGGGQGNTRLTEKSNACFRFGKKGHWKNECTAKIGHVLCFNCTADNPSCLEGDEPPYDECEFPELVEEGQENE